MKQVQKRGLALLLTLVLMCSLCVPAMAAGSDTLRINVAKSAAYIQNTVKAPKVGSIGGEWAVLGLARSGCEVPQKYWDNYYAAVEEYVEECKGVLHDKKYTEYSRVIVALTSIGADPTDVGGYNLLTALGDYDKTIWQGLNGPIWALIALDSGNYDMPLNPAAKTQATRQMYIDRILACQLADGGWSLTGKGEDTTAADPDITGMALQALAKYQDQSAVKAATEKALTCLSAAQDDKGGFNSWGDGNSESCIQVLVGLCELGVSLDDPRFVKNGCTLMDNLMSFRQKDGSFLHTTSGSGSNLMASEQALYGLTAALRAAEGKSGLYRMNDVVIHVSGHVGTAVTGLPGKHADVKKVPVSVPDATFGDVSGHANQNAIEAMAARGIINGKGNGKFDPDATMTRAEFAAIVVRALGLTPKAVSQFTDVPAGSWYAGYVGTAYTYGIVNGKSAASFDPNGSITRQEAAAMVARAAKLCGMDTALEDYEILNTLAQFTDYVTISGWARESVAFCYQEDILDQNDLNVEPGRAILRCEIAQMLCNMLDSAKLL